MSEKRPLYIGVMSGTSLNSIDCGLFELSDDKIDTLTTHEHEIPEHFRSEILGLCTPGANEIERLGLADRSMALLMSEGVKALLSKSGFRPGEIIAVGSHGQTVRHSPYPSLKKPAYTLQIGDPNTISCNTGITTVADFRRRDIALGGQGAPLAPLFHEFAFKSPTKERCIINIGGIANLTHLPAKGKTTGYDTGPGNTLMNAWIKKHKSRQYDDRGSWARSGKVSESLLANLLSENYLSLPPPKSTGRELFNEAWLETKLSGAEVSPVDLMNTLTEFTAATIAIAVSKTCSNDCEVFLCGGGAHNSFLVECIQKRLPVHRIDTSDSLGLKLDWVEAATFAWLAKCALENKKLNYSSITGSSAPYLCGAIYPHQALP